MWVVGVEADEIKLAGVRAKLGNIIFTYLCKYIQCKVAGSVLRSSSTLMQPTFGGEIKVKNLSHDFLQLVCGNVRTPANQTTKHAATNLRS